MEDAHDGTEQSLDQNDKKGHERRSTKKPVYKNFPIFTWKHLCWNLNKVNKVGTLLNKVGIRKAYNFVKKKSQTQMFYCEYC